MPPFVIKSIQKKEDRLLFPRRLWRRRELQRWNSFLWDNDFGWDFGLRQAIGTEK
jgi:hypothetical protein